MSESHAEVIIGCLWIGLGFLALLTNHEVWAGVFFLKGITDQIAAIWFALRELVVDAAREQTK